MIFSFSLVLASLSVDVMTFGIAYRIYCGVRGLECGWMEAFGRSIIASFGLLVISVVVWPGMLLLFWGGVLGHVLASCVVVGLGVIVVTWVFELKHWLAGAAIFVLRVLVLILLAVAAVKGWELIRLLTDFFGWEMVRLLMDQFEREFVRLPVG